MPRHCIPHASSPATLPALCRPGQVVRKIQHPKGTWQLPERSRAAQGPWQQQLRKRFSNERHLQASPARSKYRKASRAVQVLAVPTIAASSGSASVGDALFDFNKATVRARPRRRSPRPARIFASSSAAALIRGPQPMRSAPMPIIRSCRRRSRNGPANGSPRRCPCRPRRRSRASARPSRRSQHDHRPGATTPRCGRKPPASRFVRYLLVGEPAPPLALSPA